MTETLSGRELDAAVARLMGYAVTTEMPPEGQFLTMSYPYFCIADGTINTAPYRGRNWSPQSDATSALAAYEVLRGRGWRACTWRDHDKQQLCVIQLIHVSREDKPAVQGVGATLPEALCRALVAAHCRENNGQGDL